ncbi:MAG: excinuclease ABC subunit UvrC [Candidatus Poseidonia sp.]|nr:excinuclease ABC subunit UvrC [Poseidonia sp.]MBL6892460.1 excinuclease ABC subunit UvrC [Poseidonia sp.]
MSDLGCGENMPVDLASADLPKEAGVYLFKTKEGRVLYVGKATRLNERIRSYFASNPDRVMIPELVRRADEIECIVTQTPQAALVLERQLIREHMPRFNSMLKDGKSFPYLVLTNDEYPRIMYTRHPPKSSEQWGPFPNAGAAKQVMQLLRRQFGIRDCKELLPQGCLSMHIGLCAGPCIDGAGYGDRVKTVRRILNGDAAPLLAELVAQMETDAKAEAFEQAARHRDMIRAVRATTRQHVVSSKVYRDCDALGIDAEGDLAAIVVLHADEGMVQGQEAWPVVYRGDIGESISMFIAEHYAHRRPPRLLLSPVPLFDGLQSWLDERRGSRVEVRTPQRGDLENLATLARQNATIQLHRLASKSSGSLEQRAADEGAKALSMEQLNHIVCFDMAQLQGDERVGASVVMRNGRPAKDEYRKYVVKGDALDDLRMMKEVVVRWAKRQEEWPDLLLIDGGETHLNTIRTALEEHGWSGRFPLAALAKREETIHRKGHEPLVLDRQGRVLVHARDEAHRFVNTFHRRRRSRQRLADPLEAVEGLGAKKLQALLRHFGGRKGIEHATINALMTVPGIGPALAERIYSTLH